MVFIFGDLTICSENSEMTALILKTCLCSKTIVQNRCRISCERDIWCKQIQSDAELANGSFYMTVFGLDL